MRLDSTLLMPIIIVFGLVFAIIVIVLALPYIQAMGIVTSTQSTALGSTSTGLLDALPWIAILAIVALTLSFFVVKGR